MALGLGKLFGLEMNEAIAGSEPTISLRPVASVPHFAYLVNSLPSDPDICLESLQKVPQHKRTSRVQLVALQVQGQAGLANDKRLTAISRSARGRSQKAYL